MKDEAFVCMIHGLKQYSFSKHLFSCKIIPKSMTQTSSLFVRQRQAQSVWIILQDICQKQRQTSSEKARARGRRK